MSDPENYTVGWICAVDKEYVAARAFLDEIHDDPKSVSVHDNNAYTLGRVGRHNVVVAVAPDGEYGTQSAATVARDMMHSFPSIRIGLLVGIAGGVPSSKHDIRLGDVVVSASRNGKGGVFQYDFGKARQNQAFQATGFLNQPPPLLRTAVTALRARYESDGHQLQAAIRTALKQKPRLQRKYGRPSSGTDRLYQPTVVHPLGEERSCVEVCGHDDLSLILRTPRTEEDDDPMVHYGLVASANCVVKDAVIRENAAHRGVLCFEMEAAGLMNHFPCLVIRGICDYSDSHKNKEWQGYAAMTAAAYATDLLRRITPNKVEAEKPIARYLSEIHEDIHEIQKDVKAVVQKQHSQDDKDLLRWLTPIDYHTRQHDLTSKRQPGTGQWLLNSIEFRVWQESTTHTLFCHGIPGAGKTFLTSIVIEEVSKRYNTDQTVQIAFIYSDYRQQGNQKLGDLLASLLKQIAESHPSVPTAVRELYDRHEMRRTHASREELAKVLRDVVAFSEHTIIVIDALDELSDDCRHRLLSELFQIQAGTNLKLFLTSRPNLDIEKVFRKCRSDHQTFEIRARDEDIELYIEDRISELAVAVPERFLGEVKRAISEAAEGMFLLAQLYFGFLQDKTTIAKIKEALVALRSNVGGNSSEASKMVALNDAYERTMERITKQPAGLRQLALEVFCWVTCAQRPLTSAELSHGLAVIVGRSAFDNENLADIDTILAVCHGLVTTDTESQIVRLVHRTTYQYFDEHHEFLRDSQGRDPHVHIAERCITYLGFDAFSSGRCSRRARFLQRLQRYPLFDYAARHWGDHVREARSQIGHMVPTFLGKEGNVNASLEAMDVFLETARYGWSPRMDATGVHLAAYFGLTEIVAGLLRRGFPPDHPDDHGQTPLSWASQQGHEAVARLVLEHGADANTKDDYGITPLSWAWKRKNVAVVRILLEAVFNSTTAEHDWSD